MELLLYLAGEILFWLIWGVTFGRRHRPSCVPQVDWGDAGLNDKESRC